jgi:hypothetical protein
LASAARGHEDQARKRPRSSRRHDLRHFAAHRVTDQHVAPQVEGADDALHVVGHGGKVVPPVRRDGATPAALVDGDPANLAAEPVDHALPGARRATPIVQEDDRGLTDAACVIRTAAPLVSMTQLDVVLILLMSTN